MKITAKEISDVLKTLSKSANKHRFTSAIIAAAGAGTRMQTEDGTTKQLLTLCDIPVVVRTLLAFEKCELIDEIVVVAREDEVSYYDRFKEEYSISKLTAVVVGGETRQESVLCGFEAINENSEFVAIHDGARCLITGKNIESVLRAAYNHGAASAACRVSDTVKKASRDGFVEETVDRESLWCAQTPQVFKTSVYCAAAYTAKEEGFTATDDNLLCEHIGYPVKLVDCTPDNIKLTTPRDLAVAEVILSRNEGK